MKLYNPKQRQWKYDMHDMLERVLPTTAANQGKPVESLVRKAAQMRVCSCLCVRHGRQLEIPVGCHDVPLSPGESQISTNREPVVAVDGPDVPC